MLSPDSRLLLLAPNWLGDLVMTTPLLSLLSRSLGRDAPRLVLGVRPAWADLFAGDPRLDGVFPVLRRARHGGALGSLNLARDLRREDFAAAVVCPPSLRMGLAVRLAGIPVRVGYATDGRGRLLSRAVAPGPRGARHYSQEMLALGQGLLEDLGLPAAAAETSAGGLPRPALPEGLPRLPAEETAGPPIQVIGPGATYGAAKNWPLARVADLASLLRERGPVRIVMLGDAQATGFVHDLAGRLGLTARHELRGEAGLVDLTGRTDLRRAAAVLAGARGFVGNDSGLMHLAGALGVPTVGVFGSSNPRWTAPLGPRAGYVAAGGFDCHPCYLKTCNQPRFCLETVEAATVLAALDTLAGPSAEEVS